MKRCSFRPFSLSVALILSASYSSSFAADTPDVAVKPADVRALKARVSELEKKLGDLSAKVDAAEFAHKLEKMNFQSAHFDPSESKFQRIDSGLSSFAVSLQNVQPFADGVKITLNLGNLSSAEYNGAHLTLSYGPRLDSKLAKDGKGAFAVWADAHQDKEVDITTDIRPGAWNPVEVVLPNIEPSNFGHLNVSLSTDEISLRK